MLSESAMDASLRSTGAYGARERPDYEGALGLVLVAVLLLSTLDETALATVGRGLALVGFAFLTLVNIGAAAGVYMAAALLFSEHHFAGQGSWVERPDNYALLILVVYLILGRSFGRSAGAFGRTGAAVVLLLLAAVAHLVALIGLSPEQLSWFMRMFGIPLGMFVLLRRAALREREVRAALLVVSAAGVFAAVETVLEASRLYTIIVPRWVVDPDFNPGLGEPRIGGIPMQPEWNALVISLAFCVLLLRLDRQHPLARAAWLGGGTLCLLGVYLTYTRGAYLGLLMGGVPFFWQRSSARGVTVRRRIMFLVAAIGFAVFILFFPSEVLRSRTEDVGTVYFRFNVWIAGLTMVANHPIMGVGFGQFGSQVGGYIREVASIPVSAGLASSGTIAHNTFLSVAAELGLTGLALYIFILIGGFKAASSAAGTVYGLRGQTWVAGFTIVYLVNVQFITAHELTPNLMYFGIMGAIAGMRLPGTRAPRSAQRHVPAAELTSHHRLG